MLVYLIMFALIILLYQFVKEARGIRIYCTVICLLLTFIVGLRNRELGLYDTARVYYPRFNQILNNNYAYIFNLKDYGFQTLTFIFTRIFGDNFKLYTIVFAFPYMVAVSFFIYKYSKRPWLSYIVFTCLHYFEISYTLMRQVDAMAILCIALHFLIEKKYKMFVALVLLASLFHAISLVFIILLLFEFWKPRKWMVFPLAIVIVMFLLYPKEIMKIAYYFIESERFTRYESRNSVKNLTFFYMNTVMWLVESLCYKRNENERAWNILFTCSTICLVMSPLTMALGEMSRVAYLFGISHIVILPDIAERMKQGISRLITVFGMAIFFIIYFLVFLGPQVKVIPYYT